VVVLAAAKLGQVGVPFYDVSFRAFTASPTVEKGTPTIQRFDKRSIASLLNNMGCAPDLPFHPSSIPIATV